MQRFSAPVNAGYLRPGHAKVESNHDFIASDACCCGPAQVIAQANRIFYTVLNAGDPLDEALLSEAKAFFASKQYAWEIILPDNPITEPDAYRQAIRHYMYTAVAATRMGFPKSVPIARVRELICEQSAVNPNNADGNIGIGTNIDNAEIAQTIAMSAWFPHTSIAQPHGRYIPNDALVVTYQKHLIEARRLKEHMPIRERTAQRSGGKYEPYLWPDTGQPFAEWAKGVQW